MNPHIQRRFEELDQRLCNTPVVREYRVLKTEITQRSGQIRIRATLADGGLLEISEYVVIKPDGTLLTSKYRYHWQDPDGQVIRRWDNASHHQHLPRAPHHVHLPDGTAEGVAEPPDAQAVLVYIESLSEGH